jgi:hypothetical protein
MALTPWVHQRWGSRSRSCSFFAPPARCSLLAAENIRLNGSEQRAPGENVRCSLLGGRGELG